MQGFTSVELFVPSTFACVDFAKTPTVGKDESTIPIASYPTSGPKSDQNID